ncbi:MAG: hypothetical protein GXZ17_00330 [Candidatus Atribacteria bacterium]|nr:hypothetical protein [Candidatus Atribacteria bacterium]
MTDDVDASLNLENDGKRECIFYLSFLSGSIRNPNNGRGHALSFPIEGQKGKSKNMDSRLKISGMTDDVDAPLNFENDG